MCRKQIRDFLEFLLDSIDSSDFFKSHPNVSKSIIKEFLEQQIKNYSESENFKLYTDGASRGNPGLAGAGFVLLDGANNELLSGKKFLGEKTNNEAEYYALILALEKISEIGINKIDIFLDSELIVKQLKGEYKVKNKRLIKLYDRVKNLLRNFEYTVSHVKREKNKVADKLANEAIDSASTMF